MNTPAAVRVEELGGDTGGYRDGVDERRRVIHLRGSTPRTTGLRLLVLTLAFAASVAASFALARLDAWSFPGTAVVAFADIVFGIAWLAVAPYTLAQSMWRRAQWTRLEITRAGVIATTGPWGGRTLIEPWSARSLMVVRRHAHWAWPLMLFPTWDLYAERDDGRRVDVATLFDEDAVRYLIGRLALEHRDSLPEHARHPFAVRFGPMPQGVSCEGDPDAVGPWRIDVRCARGSFGAELLSACGVAVFGTACVVCTLACSVISFLSAIERPLPESWFCAVVGTVLLVAVTVWTWGWLRHQGRMTLLRWCGRVHVTLDGDSVSITTTPWATAPISARFDPRYGPVALRVEPRASDPTEAVVHVVRGEAMYLAAPMLLDDAEYLATLVHAHQALAGERHRRT